MAQGNSILLPRTSITWDFSATPRIAVYEYWGEPVQLGLEGSEFITVRIGNGSPASVAFSSLDETATRQDVADVINSSLNAAYDTKNRIFASVETREEGGRRSSVLQERLVLLDPMGDERVEVLDTNCVEKLVIPVIARERGAVLNELMPQFQGRNDDLELSTLLDIPLRASHATIWLTASNPHPEPTNGVHVLVAGGSGEPGESVLIADEGQRGLILDPIPPGARRSYAVEVPLPLGCAQLRVAFNAPGMAIMGEPLSRFNARLSAAVVAGVPAYPIELFSQASDQLPWDR